MTVDPSVAVTQANEALQKAEKAAPGPWREGINHWAVPLLAIHLGPNDKPLLVAELGSLEGLDVQANAAFIAAARTDVPVLARLVLDLAAENETLRKEREDEERQADKWAESASVWATRAEAAESALAASRADTEALKEALRATVQDLLTECGARNRGENVDAEVAEYLDKAGAALLAREGTL